MKYALVADGNHSNLKTLLLMLSIEKPVGKNGQYICVLDEAVKQYGRNLSQHPEEFVVVEFVSYDEAIAISRREAVVFAEFFAMKDQVCSLEVHVEVPHEGSMREIQRDDTGPVPENEVASIVGRIADQYQAKFATVVAGRATWPPEPEEGAAKQGVPGEC